MSPVTKLSPEERKKIAIKTIYSLMDKYNLDLDKSAVERIVESAMERWSKDPNVRREVGNLLLQEIKETNPELAKRIESETEYHEPSRGPAKPHETEFHKTVKGHEHAVRSETERHKPSEGRLVPSEKKLKKKRKH